MPRVMRSPSHFRYLRPITRMLRERANDSDTPDDSGLARASLTRAASLSLTHSPRRVLQDEAEERAEALLRFSGNGGEHPPPLQSRRLAAFAEARKETRNDLARRELS
jgi:hypothetical protein